MTKPKFPSFIVALSLVGALGACQQSAAPPAPDEPEQSTGPEAKPGMALTGGELVLPIVPGRPAAVYFSLNNAGDKPVMLVSAYVEGATSAEIHGMASGSMKKEEALEIKPGATLEFARGGLHVMAFELDESLAAGGTTEMTLSFADGDKLSAPVAISAGGSGEPAGHGADH